MVENAPQVGKRLTQSTNTVEAKTRVMLHKQRQQTYLYPDLPYIRNIGQFPRTHDIYNL